MSKPGAIIIEGHVQGLANARSLGEAGIPVIVVDKSNCIARYSKYCQNFFICPDFSLDDFAFFLIDLAKQEEIKDWVLIPSNDHAVRTISKHRSQLGKYFKVITPDLDVIDTIYDKSQLLGVAEQCEVPVPVTYYFKTANDHIPESLMFPIITKGKHGLSFYKTFGKKVMVANNERELRIQLQQIADQYGVEGIFGQELIPFDGNNKTISFAAFCIDGTIKTHWMGVKLREHPLRFGTATFAKSVTIPECYNHSISLLKRIGYTGVCEVEFLFDHRTKQYKLIEINARTWLWVGLARFCGVDFSRMIYDYVNHNDIDYPQSYTNEKYWINPVTDTVYSAIGMFKGKLRPKDYFSSIWNTEKNNALFVKGDWKPGLAYIVSLFSIFKNR